MCPRGCGRCGGRAQPTRAVELLRPIEEAAALSLRSRELHGEPLGRVPDGAGGGACLAPAWDRRADTWARVGRGGGDRGACGLAEAGDISRGHELPYSASDGVTSGGDTIHLFYTRNEDGALVSGDLEAGGHYAGKVDPHLCFLIKSRSLDLATTVVAVRIHIASSCIGKYIIRAEFGIILCTFLYVHGSVLPNSFSFWVIVVGHASKSFLEVPPGVGCKAYF